MCAPQRYELPLVVCCTSLPGTIDFNLTGIPEPVQDAADCSVDQLPPEEEVDEDGGGEVAKKRKASSDVTLIDLFHKKRVKGWWPVFTSEEGERELTVREEPLNLSHMSLSSPLPLPLRVSWSWR